MSMYYGMAGEPLTTEEWIKLFEDGEKRRVAFDVAMPGTDVSTVLLGLDHSWGQGRPIIFETMTFSDKPEFNEWQERYCTKEEALAGHAVILARIRETPVLEAAMKKRKPGKWGNE